ncbi:MAG: hypothetical protein MUF43_14115, partial [Flavobacterium sp.]|nr:hypothetical protein [Flavobacterium sp.]
IVIIITLIITFWNFYLGDYTEPNSLFLVFIALYQVSISIGLTIYAIANHLKLLMLFAIYWLLVVLYFEHLFDTSFYACLIVALYNLYIHYCSFSESKFNIVKK